MPDFQLNEKRLSQLDGNIKQMVSSGASEDDVMKYATDFKNQFGVKKKDGGIVSSPIPLKLPSEDFKQGQKFAETAFKAFIENNLSLLEINPLAVTPHKKIIAVDCKITVDDNALYKQKTLSELRDWSQNDSKEAEAFNAGLNYIALKGNIGCMVNGAGLAMATMDLIKLYGGEPANFLDVGGGATAETVAKAFKIILDDKNVQVVLINIFGGIMRCDIIAEGIIAAVKEVGIKIPIVVRLEGTNVDLGKKLLQTSGLNIMAANTLTEAATIATSLIKK